MKDKLVAQPDTCERALHPLRTKLSSAQKKAIKYVKLYQTPCLDIIPKDRKWV